MTDVVARLPAMIPARPSVVVCLLMFAVGTAFAEPRASNSALHPPGGEQIGEKITVEIFERIPAGDPWSKTDGEPTDTFQTDALAIAGVPRKYNSGGLIADRSNPFLLRAASKLQLPAGEYRLLLRAKNAARVTLDGRLVAETPFMNRNASGHESVPELKPTDQPNLQPLAVGHQEKVVTITLDAKQHLLSVQTIVGGKGLRAELGELIVALAAKDGPFRLVAPRVSIPLTVDGWPKYVREQQRQLLDRNTRVRRLAGAKESEYWTRRHDIARRWWADRPPVTPPDVPADMPIQNDVDRFIGARLAAAGKPPAPLADDWTFLRRVTLDTVGVIPTRDEIRAFENDKQPDRRRRAIDRLLADPRWADHWVGYWQDVLAENPGILKPKLNNTGPFRYWIYESFLDNKPVDRFATELIQMRGSRYGGGPAGFAMATQNDAPLAAKAHVIGKALLAIELKCARCHDAPYHDFAQRDTFRLAAMLAGSPQKLPKTSTVPVVEGGRKPAITISLRPGDVIQPVWPFASLAPEKLPAGLLRDERDTRQRLAAIITSPANERFARVMVNRLWKRYLGWGLIEPVDDWHDAAASHPGLLDYLARELVTHDYDLKHVARLILNSHAYQRRVLAGPAAPAPAGKRLFASPPRRRMSAEQVVDSLFAAVGKDLAAEKLTLDPEGRRPIEAFLNLGVPRRAWQFASLSNERDRPALSLPVAQSIVDVLATFGWRESRQDPLTVRPQSPTVFQPLILANGLVGSRITRLSDDGAMTTLALAEQPVEELIREAYLRILTRPPREDETRLMMELVETGFSDRRAVPRQVADGKRQQRRTAVSWSNHLNPEATRIKLELERAVRAGDPPTAKLKPDWRERMEDMLWALVNSPEFVFVP